MKSLMELPDVKEAMAELDERERDIVRMGNAVVTRLVNEPDISDSIIQAIKDNDANALSSIMTGVIARADEEVDEQEGEYFLYFICVLHMGEEIGSLMEEVGGEFDEAIFKEATGIFVGEFLETGEQAGKITAEEAAEFAREYESQYRQAMDEGAIPEQGQPPRGMMSRDNVRGQRNPQQQQGLIRR